MASVVATSLLRTASPRSASARRITRVAPRSVVRASRAMTASSSSEPKPILFLDIDGVLNRTATAPQINLEQDKVDRLREVLAVSGAEVVLSTYWRAFEEYIAYTFGRMGAQGERVVGRTPGNPHLQDSVAHDDAVKTTRIVEITSYMESRFGSDRAVWPRFAIVDDKQVVPDGHEWSGRFVRTAHDVGLTNDAVTALVSALELEFETVEVVSA
jgi:hypothetical protein